MNSYLKNKLRRENIRNNLQTLLPTNLGGRGYFKRMQQDLLANGGETKTRREEKKNTSLEVAKDPFATKVIKNLIQTEKELQKKILKIKENEKLIKSQSFLNLFNKNPINLKKDKDIIKHKVNDLSKNKSVIISRADYINSEIYSLQNKKDIQSGDFKSKILENMNKLNQNLVQLREKSHSNKIIENGSNNQLVKLLDTREEQKFLEEQKILALKHMRDLEKAEIKKRKEKNQEKVLQILKYRNVKPKKEYYLYEKLYNNYLDREDNLVKKENAKRKAYMRHIDSHEFLEMEKNYLERRIQIEENIKENKQSLKQEWTERQKLIPNYIHPILKLAKEEKVKNELEKELKLQKIIDNKNNMVNFSNKLRKPKQWKEKLDNSNLEKEKNKKNKNFNQSLACKNDYGDKIRKKIMERMRKSRENSKENEKVLNSRENGKDKKTGIQNIKLMSGHLHKRKNVTPNSRAINEINQISKTERNYRLYFNNKKIVNKDYLEEKRKKPKPKLNNLYANDIKTFLKKSGITENSLLMSKCKLDFLKEKKNQKDRLLRLNGGIAKNPEVGEELYNLSLNIIKGKLAIIEEIEKKFDKEDKIIKVENKSAIASEDSEEESEKESEKESKSKPEDKNNEEKESEIESKSTPINENKEK